ncbi:MULTISPECIES: lytic transglycosylase domain-containing protein [unclassified Ruegeria]|uniref:lytic transglycosylase domain-containing protein n=1 Tax=unclassified Ruegeria TaxID=2625375 RepID=UPI0014881B50|nr:MULTISPECIES: lytic transglycosylase domain-containing protein [unclassified Ruegeria]NOD78430.1 transglycosylase SLT domain-containing protein [Ruegeria sp. HKCCD4332]NOD90430.1 transglycosylase SLT domain-containing protein [Ruegeria sp. HKCCD4318]NOE15502.1 transglycosylase SLT domain-containing protein [Ruegeria sp. HKCCD4318-2]NOG10284.1 lytic transglycosylase domain-containing protein [Ruegeria sp. HKCCD4315]
MTRILALLIAVIVYSVTAPQLARADAAGDLRAGLYEMRKGDWNAALRVSGQRGSVSRDVIVWHWLREGFGSSGDVLVFLERRPDWPGMAWLRRKSEPVFTGADPDRVLKFYTDMPPQTAEGALNYAIALKAKGRVGDAEADIVTAWRTMPMGSGLQKTYLENFAKLLKPHHAARLDRMLWDGHLVSAGQMLPLVSADQRKLAEARIALQKRQPGVDGKVAAVPKSLMDAPGLAFDRFVWRDKKELDDSAIDLMLARSTGPDALGEPDKWAEGRRRLARLEMRSGRSARAYDVAANHHMTPEMGYGYADLEWLAGFLALRKLNDPATAVRHFQNFSDAVKSPISKGRGGYWLGRAYAAQGDADKAYDAYAMGADYQTSFYGLLAAERIGRPFDAELANPRRAPHWRQAEFAESSVLEAGLLLLKAGEGNLSERFLTHLVESLDPVQANQLGDLVIELKQPHLAVMIAKRAATTGTVLPAAYYPVHPVADMRLPMAKEMTLAIARRESEFDPVVISGAGARGLMQVMPATAKLVAGELGILSGHQTGRLTTDWQYNAKLGANYLSGLAADFNGNVVMMAAGYNAGPRRPISWMERFGDPRTGEVDIVDWIETIPFSETRNYVMRVTESLPVYRARLGQPALPIPFSQELIGSSLAAFAP